MGHRPMTPRLPPRCQQTQPLNPQTHTSKQEHHRTEMLGIEEETLVKVVEKREDYDGEIPLDRPKLRLVTRLKKTNHTITEREAEDEQYDRQTSHAHLEHDVQKSILCLGQDPGNSQNYTIGFALKPKPECLVAIT